MNMALTELSNRKKKISPLENDGKPATWKKLPKTRHAKNIECVRRLVVIVSAVLASILTLSALYAKYNTREPCEVMIKQKFSPPNSIPKLYHYQSKEDVVSSEIMTWMNVLNMTKNINSYPNINPNPDVWTPVYWSDDSCKKLCHDHFSFFASTYDGFTHTIQRVDSCRYLVLFKYGGLYADTDITLHSTAIQELIPNGIGLVESPYRYNENVQNSLMTATSAGHDFWLKVLELIQERSSSHVLASTGPAMLGDAMMIYNKELGGEIKDGRIVNVLPCELFHRIPRGHWETTYSQILAREVLTRLIPMKGCGNFQEGSCEITRHVSKASWTATTIV
mmetsp:Transcript_29822/g.44079  ORF Transcript_29822/g.44079 Transcript_29822/m.44079 type:complete len:336 (-) Transcript_29822:3-1010(-)